MLLNIMDKYKQNTSISKREEVLSKIKMIIKKKFNNRLYIHYVKESDITEDFNIVSHLHLDDEAFIEFILYLEEELGIDEIPFNKILRMLTVRDVIDVIIDYN